MVKNHSDRERGNPLPPHRLTYSFRLAASVVLYASSHRQDNTYHGLCYTSRGALAGTMDLERSHVKSNRHDMIHDVCKIYFL